VRTLASQGYPRTTARAIGRTGGFAPGVIYYHFTDLDDLFIATAQFTSQARLHRYQAETGGVTRAVDLVRRLRRLYAEDSAEGHVAAVQELVAAATASTRLAEQLRAETTVWRDFAETVLRNLLSDSPLAALVPTRELATAAVAAYLGMELLSHLDADRAAPEALFDAAERAAALADSVYLR
jgi:AcrR family transcriptional regulator